MKEPLNQFTDRLIRNNEIEEFIKGLVREKDVPLGQLSLIIKSMFEEKVPRSIFDENNYDH